MFAVCPQCKAKVSVVFVLANVVALREIAAGNRVQVIHVSSTGDHVWLVSKDDLMEK
jgi:hypothetical protein